MKNGKTLASRMNKRVTISRLPTADDGPEYLDSSGQPLDTLIPVVTVWAGIEPLKGREYFAAMREHVEVTTRIYIRYREDINSTMIVQYDDDNYEILHIIHPELARVELQLMCKVRQ